MSSILKGEPKKNSFINFKDPDQPPVTIFQGGVGPRLIGNTFSDCVEAGNRYKNVSGVSSSEGENKMNDLIGDNVKRGKIRRCRNCKKTGSCVLCSGCKTVYYCDEQCQKQHWGEHQEFCIKYSKAKNK